MKVLNSSRNHYNVQIVREDGSLDGIVVAPGVTKLPRNTGLAQSHPHLQLLDDEGKAVSNAVEVRDDLRPDTDTSEDAE